MISTRTKISLSRFYSLSRFCPLQTVPTRAIISFSGKKLHHPINQ